MRWRRGFGFTAPLVLHGITGSIPTTDAYFSIGNFSDRPIFIASWSRGRFYRPTVGEAPWTLRGKSHKLVTRK